jgi:hypothetical protein
MHGHLPIFCVSNQPASRQGKSVNVSMFVRDQDFKPESLACFWALVSLSHAEGHPLQQKAIFCPL